jgi:hypothetical protein
MADVHPGVDDVYIDTRRQLHGVAEILIAGPQYRRHGTIRLAARPGGFGGILLQIAVEGTELVWPGRRAALAGPVRELAMAAGVDTGPPVGVYQSSEPLSVDSVLDLDPGSAAIVNESFDVGAEALRTLARDQEPVLWPEHFDVAVTVEQVNYGVSAGDSCHPRPYAYVGPSKPHTGPFWNAPFGALLPLRPADSVDPILDFFEQGRRLTVADPH